MGIDVALVNARHEPGQRVFDPRQRLSLLAAGEWQRWTDSVCLRFIDPWGDTVFNQAQVPVLLAELEQACAAQADPDMREHLHRVCRLVERAQGRLHVYVKFSGD